MKVEKNNVVALSYILYKNDENGEILEVCKPEKPLEFVFGSGLLLPKFEENIVNLEEGDDFDFVLAPSEAYGDRVEDAVVEISLDIFKVDGVVQKDILFVGSEIPMRDNQGNPLTGKVVKVDEGKNVVVMDFNHPLAGINLYFSGKIESVRVATEEELAHGLHRGCGGCHCGDGNNSCGGGCGEGNDGGCCGGCH